MTRRIPDLVITIFIFAIGLITIVWLFYNDIKTNGGTLLESFLILYQSFPIIYAAFYLWGKAVVTDLIRIKTRQELTMPGFVFLTYGFLWVSLWMTNDIIGNSLQIVSPSSTKLLFYHNLPIIWAALDAIFSIGISLLPSDTVPKNKLAEVSLLKVLLRSYLLFVITTIIGVAIL